MCVDRKDVLIMVSVSFNHHPPVFLPLCMSNLYKPLHQPPGNSDRAAVVPVPSWSPPGTAQRKNHGTWLSMLVWPRSVPWMGALSRPWRASAPSVPGSTLCNVVSPSSTGHNVGSAPQASSWRCTRCSDNTPTPARGLSRRTWMGICAGVRAIGPSWTPPRPW